MNAAAAISFPVAEMKKTKKIALAAVLASLIFLILLLGALVGFVDGSSALAASVVILFCVVELGYKVAMGTFGAVAILALLLLPNKAPAILFAAVFGYLPMTKFFFEKVFRRFSWIPKLILFNAVSLAVGLLFFELFGLTTSNPFGISPTVMKLLYLLLANVIFVLTDIFYTSLVLLYLRKYRDKIRKYLK